MLEVTAHAHAAIATARLETDPTAYLVVPEVLPAPTFAELLAHLPPPAMFPPRGVLRGDLYPSKDPMPEADAAVWTLFEQRIVPILSAAVAARLAPHIGELQARFAHLLQVGSLVPHDGRIMLRRPGWVIKPHVDPSSISTVTALYYLTRPGDSEQFGTSFYRVVPPFPTLSERTVYPHKAVGGHEAVFVATVPARANLLLAFVNVPEAAHGAEFPATATQGERYVYQWYLHAASVTPPAVHEY